MFSVRRGYTARKYLPDTVQRPACVVRKLLQTYFTTEVVNNTTKQKTNVAPLSAKKMGVVFLVEVRKNIIIIAWTVRNCNLLLYVLLYPPLVFTFSGGGGATSCSIV